MKMKLLYVFIVMLVITGCVKTIASDENNVTDFSFHERSYGASARDLLTADKYTSLNMEVQYMPGYKPNREALMNLRSFLEKHLNKPDGITMFLKEIKPSGRSFLTRSEVDSIRKVNRTVYSTNNQLAVHILYTDGDYVNSKILGESYRNTTIVLFGKALKENSGTIGKLDRTTLETTLLLHEFGHLLGLINKGTAMYTDHKDSVNESHCNNKKCLMYYGVDVEDKFGPLLKREVPQLDDECLFDLVTNGGK